MPADAPSMIKQDNVLDKQMDQLIVNALPALNYGAAEALNTLWTNLSYSGSNVKVIAFTSCRPDEGKSFMVMHLAHTIISSGKRVLIIDADLRKSVIAGRYRVRSLSGGVWGVAHYLTGQCDSEQIIYQTNIPLLSMALAGHEVLDSFSLLDSPLLPHLIESVRDHYDVILIDTPPVGTIIDAAIIARHCDGVVLVVKEGLASRSELAEARAQIEKVGGRVLGAVLNDVQFSSHGVKKYYYKAYHRYDTSQYGYYGGDDGEKKAR